MLLCARVPGGRSQARNRHRHRQPPTCSSTAVWIVLPSPISSPRMPLTRARSLPSAQLMPA